MALYGTPFGSNFDMLVKTLISVRKTLISRLEFLLIKERPYIEFVQAPFGSNFDMWIKTLISKNEPNGVGPNGHNLDIKV